MGKTNSNKRKGIKQPNILYILYTKLTLRTNNSNVDVAVVVDVAVDVVAVNISTNHPCTTWNTPRERFI